MHFKEIEFTCLCVSSSICICTFQLYVFFVGEMHIFWQFYMFFVYYIYARYTNKKRVKK